MSAKVTTDTPHGSVELRGGPDALAYVLQCRRDCEELRQNLESMVREFGGRYPIKSNKGFALNLSRACLSKVAK